MLKSQLNTLITALLDRYRPLPLKVTVNTYVYSQYLLLLPFTADPYTSVNNYIHWL